ncbi:MAG: isopenicillin-n epimerase [Verrucomicrobiales bacterium]|nr:isopenicillin-n epimerase [Verrucomicrobiales bacterium]
MQIIDQDLQTPLPADPRFWLLDPSLTFLNHGSFGSCPRPVIEYQAEIRQRLERDPIQFLVRDLEPMLDEARETLAKFVGTSLDDLVFVPNATTGVNTVLNSFPWEPGDEALVTSHEYNACSNALRYHAERHGATVEVIDIPFPTQSATQVVDAVRSRLGKRTRFVLVDHVTSQTGLIFPVKEIVNLCRERGIATLIDGAHAPGMVDLDLKHINPTFYTGNCHKWICAPKGAAFLYVDKNAQSYTRPLTISHGASTTRRDRSRFQVEFGWTGTGDPSASLSIPFALSSLGALHPEGWTGLRKRNKSLVLRARKILSEVFPQSFLAPVDMIGSLASVVIPAGKEKAPGSSPLYLDNFQEQLRKQYRIEVPVVPWPKWPSRLLRVSAQAYNTEKDYHYLADSLKKIQTEIGHD